MKSQFVRRMSPTEKQIETSIIQWLKYKGIFAFKIENGGVFDQKRNVYRVNDSIRIKGVADIVGIYKGKPLAIEVKSLKGKLSTHQIWFLEEWKNNGGIAIVARSIEDVASQLEAA